MRDNARTWVAALMVLVTAGGPISSVRAEDESTDLKVEFVGLSGQRDVKLEITNVSAWWADETTVTVETVSPGPANPMALFVENLGPGQRTVVTYRLGASCNGHEVVAVLAPARNYAGVLESNLENNRAPETEKPGEGQKLCAAKPQGTDPSKTGVQTQPLPGDLVVDKVEVETRRLPSELVVVPEFLQPGEHTLAFEPTATARAVRLTREGALSPPLWPGLLVGWSQWSGGLPPLGGDVVAVAQSAAAFDLSQLKDIPPENFIKVVLSFDEVAARWTDGDGHLRVVEGCVSALGVATTDWANSQRQGLFRNRTIANVTPNAASAWDVTTQVKERSAPFGYVLRGSLEEGLEADDDSSCMSEVSNIKLRVTYKGPGTP